MKLKLSRNGDSDFAGVLRGDVSLFCSLRSFVAENCLRTIRGAIEPVAIGSRLPDVA